MSVWLTPVPFSEFALVFYLLHITLRSFLLGALWFLFIMPTRAGNFSESHRLCAAPFS